MGEARFNPVAKANGVARQKVQVMDIGEGFCLLGVQVTPVMKEVDGKRFLAIVMMAVGGRPSDLVPMQPASILLGEIASVSIESVHKALGLMLDGPPKDAPPEPEAA